MFRFRISVPIFAVAKLICDILAALCNLPASPERVRGSHSFGWVCPTKASVPVPLGRMWHSHTGGRTLLGIVHHITLSMSVPRIERFARFVLDGLCEFCRPAKLVQAEMQSCHSNIDSNRLHENLGRRKKRKRL